MNHQKYRPFPPMKKSDRKWPDRTIVAAPRWCSVDLRDGNQSIERPMSAERKRRFFTFLTDMGFKEIEIGFPSASPTEFEFTRSLIDGGLIPGDVVPQVLTQSREDLIRQTFESLDGVRRAVVHLYNSTSPLQREVVFGKTKSEVKALAVSGAELILELARRYGEDRFIFEYSPENFSETEPDFALEVVNAVLDVWKPTPEKKAIINLPSTVEQATPNVFADQVEYFAERVRYRGGISISVHAHNDRGSAVAATELALMAGADRVEGTLFGNGERTGNADILTLALNMYTHGIDPGLDFSRIDDVVTVYEESTGMYVHPRHPYAGRLVYTSFSGSHQNAISRGMAVERPGRWLVPYLPIDPADVGRSYAEIVRFNAQSGGGGATYILEKYFGLEIPKAMRRAVGREATAFADALGRDVSPEELFGLFSEKFVNIASPLELVWYDAATNGVSEVSARVRWNGEERRIAGTGNGSIDAFVGALASFLPTRFEVVDYKEHSMTDAGVKSKAITYVRLRSASGEDFFGAGVSTDIPKSAMRAIVSAANRMMAVGD
ncbi:MAG: 2-isopropylmalate synthase [Clostridiales bacterium]|nr:2-isopropylmalate synthase [Clostridiales bacterium]